MNCSNKCSLIWFYDSVGSCVSIFLAARKLFAARLFKKCVWRLHLVCSFWEAAYQFGNSNHFFVSFFITGGLTNARKRLFDLHLMNTEDHLFPHNGLSANIFSTLDAGPSYRIQNPLIDSDCCDKQQPRGYFGQWIKISPDVFHCFAWGELDFGVGSTQKDHWIILLGSASIPSQTQLSLIRSCVNIFFWYMGQLAWAWCLIES